MAAACHDDSRARESHTYPLPVAIPCNALTHFFPRAALRISHASPLRLSCRPLLSQLRPSGLAMYIPCRALQAQSPFSYIVHQSFGFLSCPFYIPQHTSLIRFLRIFSAVYTATILDLCCVVKCSHISLHASMQIYMLHFISLFTKKAPNYYRSGPSNFKYHDFKYHNLKKYALAAFHHK